MGAEIQKGENGHNCNYTNRQSNWIGEDVYNEKNELKFCGRNKFQKIRKHMDATGNKKEELQNMEVNDERKTRINKDDILPT